jgi:glyoxylase-like metal-dependent hydrolase (beta-lactamase superfamily II)
MKKLILVVIVAALLALAVSVAGPTPTAAAADEGRPWFPYPRAEWAGLPIVDVKGADPWFEVHLVRPNVYAIYEPANWQEVISYLLIGKKKALLFDTGMNIGDMKALTDKLTKLPVFVVNSHAHMDHVGCNYEYKEVWGYDDEYGLARASEAGRTHDQSTFAVDPSSMWSAWPLPARYSYDTYAIPAYKVTHWMTDGEKICLGTMTLEVVWSPGHSPDGICLLDREHGLLWVGDVWYNSWLGVGDLPAYTATAAKLAALTDTVDYVLPSHNVALFSSSCLTAMDEAFKSIAAKTATNYVDDHRGHMRYYDFGDFKMGLPLKWVK